MKKYFEEKMATYDDYFFTASVMEKRINLWQISEF